MNLAVNTMKSGSAPQSKGLGSLKSLQVGRAVAAVLVCAFHLSVLFEAALNTRTGSFQSVTWWGFRGVDYFFVLSGFIIVFAHQNDIGRTDRVGRYFAKRISRVYPVYWLYTTVFVGISALGAGALLAPMGNPGALMSALLLIRFSGIDPPLAVAWTLFHEVIFYAAFATLIVDRRLGILVLAGWLFAILAFQTWPTPHTIPGTLFSTFNLNFFFGMLAFALHQRVRPFLAGVLIGAGVVGVVIFLVADARLGGSITVQVGFAAAFASVIAGCAALERSGREWRVSTMVLLGDASYSLYLVHTNVEVYLLKAVQRLPFYPDLPVWSIYLVILATTVGAGLVAHLVVEKPLTQLIRRGLAVRRQRTVQDG